MKFSIVQEIEKEKMRDDLPDLNPGDTVKVHCRVVEGDKERIQIFSGVIIAIKGSLINKAITVRKISYGEGVERVFMLHSPLIAKIEVSRFGNPRRAKLYYLRNRVGRKALFVKEKKSQDKKTNKKPAKDKAKAEAKPQSKSKPQTETKSNLESNAELEPKTQEVEKEVAEAEAEKETRAKSVDENKTKSTKPKNAESEEKS